MTDGRPLEMRDGAFSNVRRWNTAPKWRPDHYPPTGNPTGASTWGEPWCQRRSGRERVRPAFPNPAYSEADSGGGGGGGGGRLDVGVGKGTQRVGVGSGCPGTVVGAGQPG